RGLLRFAQISLVPRRICLPRGICRNLSRRAAVQPLRTFCRRGDPVPRISGLHAGLRRTGTGRLIVRLWSARGAILRYAFDVSLQARDGGVSEIEGLHAVRALDAQQAVDRADVTKEESTARPDLQDARNFAGRADIVQAPAAAALFLDL